MNQQSKVRIGHRAPEFQCDAVTKGVMGQVTLDTYIDPHATTPNWLIILFIPAAFSFVCPIEVLAFQNCLDEFKDRNCNVVFVSVDTKHSLWHWQNVPRQYGGLGQTDVSLLSDSSHRMSRDYGVLIEEEGVCLRGMFILDGEGIVQQVTLNNVTVGRSVLETLRLLKAFQAVAKHGVLCPVDWRPSNNTTDTLETISNMLTESYDVRLANLQKDFGGQATVTDLDAKHKQEKNKRDGRSRRDSIGTLGIVKSNGSRMTRSQSQPLLDDIARNDDGNSIAWDCDKGNTEEITPRQVKFSDGSLQRRRCTSAPPSPSLHSTSAPASANITPTPTPFRQDPLPLKQPARHARGHSSAPSKPYNPSKPDTYESECSRHIALEFADPTPPVLPLYPSHPPHHTHAHSCRESLPPSRTSSPASSQHSSRIPTPSDGASASQTRLQATFEAIKQMSAGLNSPGIDIGARESAGGGASVEEEEEEEEEEESKSPGYFDAVEGDV